MLGDRLLDGRLRLRHLVTVIEVAERGSIGATAKALHVTQPAITRTVQEVESILGVPLFERHAQGMRLTAYGKSFIADARLIIKQVQAAGDRVEAIQRADLGEVRVGAHVSGSTLLLPLAITAVKKAHPHLRISIHDDTPDRLEAVILDGDVDLLIGRLRKAAPSLVQVPLHREPLALVTRVGHPAHSIENLKWKDLVAFPWVVPVAATRLRREIEALIASEGLALPDDVVECTALPILRQLVISSDRLAPLPMMTALEDPDLSVVRFSLAGISRTIGITIPADRPRTEATKALLRALHEQAQVLAEQMDAALERAGLLDLNQ